MEEKMRVSPNKFIKSIVLLISTVTLLVMAGCATTQKPTNPKDPYQHFNEKAFKFNENLDNQVFKPIAKGYAKVVPAPARHGISNFFQNLDEPGVIANDVLQGDYLHAMADSWRFFINSTFGLFGIFDVASKMQVPIPYHANDFGLTLRYWGLMDPKYLVVPFFGPTTDIDLLGRLVNYYAFSPIAYLRHLWVRSTVLGVYYLNRRAQLLSYDDLLNAAALNPYVFMRNAYMQHRNAQYMNLRAFIHAEYHSLGDTEPGYFLKPSRPWSHSTAVKGKHNAPHHKTHKVVHIAHKKTSKN